MRSASLTKDFANGLTVVGFVIFVIVSAVAIFNGLVECIDRNGWWVCFK